MRRLRIFWLFLAVLAIGLMHFGDRAAYVDGNGMLHESILLPVGIMLLLLAWAAALLDLFTCKSFRNPS
ncbi:TPA: hypothetical protein ACIAHZ_003997 [Enterobacter roggenkampii]|uniref:hypothetical protein n=1 Tax=Enterobacter roggenkampii TaxID=1812935 RepID=UPI003785D307